MRVVHLSKQLSTTKHAGTILKELLSVKEDEIQGASQSRNSVLKRCVSFCEAAAQRQQYEQIAKMLSFIRTTNNDDDWLLSASQIILPRLKNIYAQILSGADPSRVESTKAMKVSISRTIQRDKYALRALSACFDVCVDFCDVVAEHTQEHLCVFLRTSAAVLFGSDFQRERDTLNETDYAMDELARSSSYALSNILITFPSIVSTAEAILGKRIRALCNCLCSSPELSIQKSLILILRVLYENGGDGSSKSLQSAIEKEISSSRLGSGVGLSLFKGIRYDDQDVVNQCERVLKKIFEKTPKEAICFKVESCSMQAKSGAHQVERRRVPFQTVSADWNKNTIITHDGKDVPQYWPIFSIMNFEWKKNRRELHLLHAAFGGREEMQMTIRFNLGGMGDAAKNVVGDRIRRIMELSMGQNESLDQSKPLEDRKVSVVSSKEDNRVEQEKISESSADVSGQTEHDESLQSGPKYGDTDGTIFSSIAADGVLVSKGSKESSFRSRNSGGESSSETFVHAPVHATSKKRRSEPSGDVPQPRKKRNVTDKDDHKVSSSPPPSRPVTVSSEEIAASSKQGRQASEMDRESSMKTAMQSSGACNTILKRDREQDYSPATQDCNGNSKIMNTRRPGRELQGGSSPKERIILKQANGRGNEQTLSLEPTVVHASRSDRQAQIPGPGLSKYPSVESLDHMNKEDERMKKKLQSIVRRVLKWKKQQRARLIQSARTRVKQLRVEKENKKQGLVTEFVSNIKKRSDSRKKKQATLKNECEKDLADARKRLMTVKKSLFDCRNKLRQIKSRVNRGIEDSKVEMSEARGEMDRHLAACLAKTRRHGNNRAKRDSLFQGLADLFKRNY